MAAFSAKFHVGQLVHHRLFGYRGVVLDVDPCFSGSGRWTRPRKAGDRPWYHVLVDAADLRTYVAERNLEPDGTGLPVDHPEVRLHFASLDAEGYHPRRKGN